MPGLGGRPLGFFSTRTAGSDLSCKESLLGLPLGLCSAKAIGSMGVESLDLGGLPLGLFSTRTTGSDSSSYNDYDFRGLPLGLFSGSVVEASIVLGFGGLPRFFFTSSNTYSPSISWLLTLGGLPGRFFTTTGSSTSGMVSDMNTSLEEALGGRPLFFFGGKFSSDTLAFGGRPRFFFSSGGAAPPPIPVLSYLYRIPLPANRWLW